MDVNTDKAIWQLLTWMVEDAELQETFIDILNSNLDEAIAFMLELGLLPAELAIPTEDEATERQWQRVRSKLKRVWENIRDNGVVDTLENQERTVRGNNESVSKSTGPSPGALGTEKEPEYIVNTGFATTDQPEKPLSPHTTLTRRAVFLFWLEVGGLIENSIEIQVVELPADLLPSGAELHVTLYSFDDEGFILQSGQTVGIIQLQDAGGARVTQRVAEPTSAGDLLDRRLFFPVAVPNGRTARLRCSIYYQNTLVQSRLIEVRTGRDLRELPDKLVSTSTVDYTLSKSLRNIQGFGKTRLSLMLNDNGNGTHGFRFFGKDGELQNDATMGELELVDFIGKARGALRQAAWGNDQPYARGNKYRYFNAEPDALKEDIIRMALRGYRFYDALITRLAGDSDKAWDLADWMRQPGQIQLASKQDARKLIPAAMFYDYPLDEGQKTAVFSLCPQFIADLQTDKPLEECTCFQGNCPTYDDDLIVCPSGFWGYRHYLGMPVSINTAPDTPTEIKSPATPELLVTVSTDPNFRLRPDHEKNLQAMKVGWEYADDRDVALAKMKTSDSQVIYFYCHGGLQGDLPYLSVGPLGSPRFTRASLRTKRIRWRQTRPLVFINGCHTTALTPELAIDLVSGFIEVSHAAGVIGTEITIFEPVAVAFAEEFFRRFLTERQSLGEAVRGARLKMLKDGNPLGLVYIPYALPTLKVVSS